MPLSYAEQQVLQELEQQFASPSSHRLLGSMRRHADLLLAALMLLTAILFPVVLICLNS
jgi:hypothetical protein